MYLIGIDIGGTKCAVSLGKRAADGGVRLLHRCESRAGMHGPRAAAAVRRGHQLRRAA